MKKGSTPVVYWHRELPPRDADPIGSHTIEAISDQRTGTFVRRDIRVGSLLSSADGAHRRPDRTGNRPAGRRLRARAGRPSSRGMTTAPAKPGCTGRFDYELYRARRA